jgi:hypothetical protein
MNGRGGALTAERIALMTVSAPKTPLIRFTWPIFTALILLASAGDAAAAPAAEIAFEDVFSGFRFPQLLGSFSFQNRVEYAYVDLGYGMNYVDRTGATATIVVYTLNQQGIANGTEDARVLEEFGKLDAQIAAFARQSRFASMSRIDTPRLSKAWLQATHDLMRQDGRGARVYSFIRGQNGRFVKIRITSPSEATLARLPGFLLGVSRAIGMLNAAG